MAGSSPLQGIPNVRDARELVEIYFGIRVTVRPIEHDVSVGATAVQLGKIGNKRVGVILGNNGAAAVAVAFNSNVTATTGIIIPSNGTYFSNWFQDGEMIFYDIWGISVTGTNGIHVVEYELQGF